MLTLDFTPPSITVRSVIGATLAFSVTLKHKDGTPFDLSGYTVTAPFLPLGEQASPVPALTVEVTDVGTAKLSLTEAQTLELGATYVNTSIVWSWAFWLSKPDERLEPVRGGLVLVSP